MPAAHRVFRRFLDQKAARNVLSRFVWAMSRDEAKRTLGIPKGETLSDDDIRRLYGERVRSIMRSSPDAAKTQEEFKELNIAKDTLLGQFDRKEPGQPNAPERGRGFQPNERDRVKEEPKTPPPTPEGMPFSSALSSLGNVDWKILTTGHWGYDVLVDNEGPPRTVYFAYTSEFILIGRSSTHYVFAKLTRNRNVRGTGTNGQIVRWDGFKTAVPLSHNLVKLAPKAIKSLRGEARGRSKFMVLDDQVTENKLDSFRGTLSLPDAIAGSGILPEGSDASGIEGRKVQIEIEAVSSREKFEAWKADHANRRFDHMGYDWYVYVNGRKTELSADEMMRLEKNHFLMAVLSYDYKPGKKNLTKLKGGGRNSLKPTAKEALRLLADGLDAGPLRTTVEQAAAAAAEAK